MKECISETQKSNITFWKNCLELLRPETLLFWTFLATRLITCDMNKFHFSLFTSLIGLFKHWSGVTKKAFLIYIKCLYVDMEAHVSGPCLYSVVIFLVKFKLITSITINFFRKKRKETKHGYTMHAGVNFLHGWVGSLRHRKIGNVLTL